MIHTVELSKMIDKDTYEKTIAELHLLYNKSCFYTMNYAEQGLLCIRLYKIKNKKYKDTEDDSLMYLYMISITVNTGSMFGGDPHLSNNIIAFTDDFVKTIYFNIFDVLPWLECTSVERPTIDNYSKEKYEKWLRECNNVFKARRIDYTLDIKTMCQQYLTLIDRGYSLRKGCYERNYFDNEYELEDIVSEDIFTSDNEEIVSNLDDEVSTSYTEDDFEIPDLEDEFPTFKSDIAYVYYRGNGVNINIYHKGQEIVKEQLAFNPNTDYDFLRIEVQVKKSKLNALVQKYRLNKDNRKGRELQYLISPYIEGYILDYYIKALTGTGMYVPYDMAIQIIDEQNYRQPKKQKMKSLIDMIAKRHSIAKVLELVENGTITDLGTLSNVKSYLKIIHNDLGINPVTLSTRMKKTIPVSILTNTTGGKDKKAHVLPSLVDVVNSYNQQIQAEQLQGTPITDEVLKQIDKI